MKVTPITTDPITPQDRDLFAVLDRHLPALAERSIVAVTSKIVAMCEGRVVRIGDIDKAAFSQSMSHRNDPSSGRTGRITGALSLAISPPRELLRTFAAPLSASSLFAPQIHG